MTAAGVLVAACSAATSGSKLPIPAGALELKAMETTFAPARLTVPADHSFDVYFDNTDTMPHNVVVIDSEGHRIFVGDIFTGPGQRVLHLPALAPGTYELRCDIHAEMTGELEVVAGTPQPSP